MSRFFQKTITAPLLAMLINQVKNFGQRVVAMNQRVILKKYSNNQPITLNYTHVSTYYNMYCWHYGLCSKVAIKQKVIFSSLILGPLIEVICKVRAACSGAVTVICFICNKLIEKLVTI